LEETEVIFPNPVRFARALWRVLVTWINGGKVIAPPEEQHKRRFECSVCTHHEDGQCKLCTCFTEMKVIFATEECPDRPPRWKKMSFKTLYKLGS
jgi:hypothetical protein